MPAEHKYAPVVLMIEKDNTGAGRAAREWIENSRFQACDADNIFEALEGMSDFTVRNRPDVIVLDVESCCNDFQRVRNAFDTQAGGHVPILALSGKPVNSKDCFQGDLAAVASRLERIIPNTCSI
jgi:DNA-binding response OmpR family regulator